VQAGFKAHEQRLEAVEPSIHLFDNLPPLIPLSTD
jgi:hypothetical protein